MAGLTKVAAVSQMLMGVRMNRVAALDGSGSAGVSDAADAEFVLDTVIEEFIIAGHPSATKAAQIFTASAGGVVDVGSSPEIVAVRGVGKHAGRRFTLSGTSVYDEGYGSTQCFASSEANIILDLHYKVASTSPNNFELLDPGFKTAICNEAVRRYRALKLPDPFMDANFERVQTANLQAGTGATDRRVERPAGTTPYAQTQRQQRGNLPQG